MLKYYISFILIFLTLSIFPVYSKTYEMIPGYGIEGVVYFGNTKSQILSSWGEPSMIISLEDFFGPFAAGWKGYFYPKYSINLAFNSNDKIVIISASSNTYSTPEGIKVGDDINKAIKIYGNNYTKEKSGDKNYEYTIKYKKPFYQFNIKNNIIGEIVISSSTF